MNKVKRRAMSALLVAALVVCGIGVYILRYIQDGAAWATFAANSSVYTSGVLSTGTLTDRDGVVLAQAADGERHYADDAAVRRACYHAVGDYAGNIGTGALGAFSAELAGYNPITGATATGGNTVALTLDSALCVTAQNALSGRKGMVLVSNYKTGEILCMTSSPTTDPADESATLADGTYINRCLNAAFTPGSVFKLITSAAAIEKLSDIEEQRFTCSGSVDVAGVTVTCTGVHGTQTFEDALANSCNCAFAQISLELGADTLADYAKSLGFTEQLEFDGITTAAGSFTKGASGSANLAWSGIGQYEDLICPYAMLRYVAAIANGGESVQPRLLLDETSGTSTLLKTATANKLRDMMSYNVSAHYGTSNFPGLNLCAKTGTAEVGDGTSHAWFTGFLLDDAHPYAFVVLVENGGGGLSVAGSVANTVLQAAVAG